MDPKGRKLLMTALGAAVIASAPVQVKAEEANAIWGDPEDE